MTKDQRLADLYRRKEEQRKINAKLPIAEKMAIAARLHEVQEKLAPIREANKVKRRSDRTRIKTPKERAYVYKPAVTRRQFVSRHLGDLVDRLFGGSAESLVISLVEAKHLKPQTLARLNKLLKEQEGKADENS